MFKNLSTGAIGIQANMAEGLTLAKEAGFDGLDLNIGEASQLAEEHSVQHVKDLWEDAGITMGGWGFGVNWRGSDADYYAGLSQLPARAELAAELGCFRTTTVVGPASNDMSFQENWDFSVKRLRSVAEILNVHGHAIGLEFIGPATSRKSAKHLFAYSMDAMLGLAAAVGTGNVGLLFDTWHWYTCRSTVDDVRKLSASDVVYVHINDAPAGIDPDEQIDNIRCLPAETGVIPLTELMQILSEIGYDGPVTPEPFSKSVNEMSPPEAAKTTAKSLKQVWDNAGL
ncbi:MAG: sugar phosphate isomerase/epimerase [Candidatus Poribacteria bacterium]|nr:sugar phosphate isomerase/epimerase [Candidatus Poribacteria bacterium]